MKGADRKRRDTGNPNSDLPTLLAMWPTPDAFVSNDGEQPETFLARQERQKAKGINGNGMGLPLAMAAKVWPTPNATDGDKGSPAQVFNGGGASLTKAAVDFWSTPRATDGEKGGPNQSFGAGGMPLPAQTVQWATPSVADTTGGRMARSGERSNEPLLKGQSERLSSSLQDRIIYPVGQTSSHPRRSLNPLFVEWLMGWPPGWTLLAWTDFACSATALCLYKQRMRFALSQLGSPTAAPPAQLALFG